MVKQQKIVRDAGGPSKRPAVVISGSFKPRNIAPFNAREKRLAGAVLRMLSQKRPDSETEGEPEGPKVGDGTRSENGAVTPGSYTNGEGSKEFLSTGRTGRRNAMPDILGHHADTGTADLSTRLEALTTKHDEPGTSGLGRGQVSSSSHQQMG